ncbi:MAG: sigma-70 family RNA polymerase sigma factor [Phycisphaerae bacterium]|nr:sigma-70 family RNA polymerase sigma factor [Phycisphaerae bacterium]
MLLKQILAEEMDYMDNSEFAKPDAERRIYEELPEIEKPDVSWYRPLMDDLTPARDRAAEESGETARGKTRAKAVAKPRTGRSQTSILLTGAQERILFLKYNFARRQVRELQKRLAEETGNGNPSHKQARSLLQWYHTAKAYRVQIAETNLALVLAMAKRVRMSEVDFADLISEGNMALLRSVDKFDCARGFKFSTYACRAILKAFSRHGIKFSKYRQRFPTDFDPAMEKGNHLETLRATHERESAAEVKHIVLTNRADLSDVERTVIDHRFNLNGTSEQPPLTLEQVGQIIGVTKERVRQIQNKALEKIRVAMEEANPEMTADVANRLGVAQGRRSVSTMSTVSSVPPIASPYPASKPAGNLSSN